MRSEKEIDAAKIYHRKNYEEESFIIFLLYQIYINSFGKKTVK